MVQLSSPLSADKVRLLRVGDEVQISGIVFTGRDAVHKYLAEGGAPPPGLNLRNGILFHCGPVMQQKADGTWECQAAGPTTSMREEPYQAAIIRTHGLRGVIGKGGMGQQTLAACQECGCVYFHAVGGAAQVLARHIRHIRNVYFLEEFGAPEAVWELEVADFPAVVTMDAHGRSLHEEVLRHSQAAFAAKLSA